MGCRYSCDRCREENVPGTETNIIQLGDTYPSYTAKYRIMKDSPSIPASTICTYLDHGRHFKFLCEKHYVEAPDAEKRGLPDFICDVCNRVVPGYSHSATGFRHA